MQIHHAECQAGASDKRKARFPEFFAEVGRTGKVFHRVGKVGIGFGVTADQPCEAGHDHTQIPVVEGTEQGRFHRGEFKDAGSSARDEHAVHFLQRVCARTYVADAEGHGHGVERGIRQGEASSVGHQGRDALFQRAFCLAFHAEIQHGTADVGRHNAEPGMASAQGDAYVQGSGGKIQHPARGTGHYGTDEMAPPPEIQPQAECMILQIIPRRQAAEHITDGPGMGVGGICICVRGVLVLRRKDIPVLLTFRTSKEGGEKEISVSDYAALNIAAAQSGYVDLIDVEAFTGDEVVKTIINAAHEAGVKVIASNHDFFKTPEKEEIIRRLRMMQDFGADIPKMAVMPTCKQDVLTLLSATLEMSEKYADRPIITMSMAGTGVVSRLTGETFGSALTFGAASKASAPGQVGVHELKKVLDIIHSSL